MRRVAWTLIVTLALATGAATAFASHTSHAGSLDRSFSGNGKALIDFPGDCPKSSTCADRGQSMAVDSRGRIIVGGVAEVAGPGAGSTAEIARLKRNGELDRSFSGDGTRRLPGDGVGSIAIDSKNRIVVSTGGFSEAGRTIRLDTDGHLDKSFGEPRRAGYSVAAAVDSQDRVLAAREVGGADSGLQVVRFKANGAVDPTFDSEVVPFENFAIEDMAIDNKGRIVVQGYEYIVRFRANGGADPKFDGDGIVVRPDERAEGYGCSCSSVTTDSHNRIISGGRNVIHRYRTDGSLDPSFSGDGRLRTGKGPPHRRGFEGASVAIDSRDRVLVAGAPAGTGEFRHAHPPARLARFKVNGKPDRSFGDRGRTDVRTGAFFESGPYAIVYYPVGDRVLTLSAGDAKSKGRGGDFALARYLGL